MSTHYVRSLGPSTSARRALLSVVGVALAVAACSTDRRPELSVEPERLGTSRKALTATDFVGTSLGAKQIALTFDDGPGSRTLELSAFLKAEGIKATFFVNGHCFGAGNPCGNPAGATPASVFTKIVADGHLVSNHTQNHVDLRGFPNNAAGDAQVVAEVSDTDALIAPYVPVTRFLLRAPMGYWDAQVYNAIHATPMDKYTGFIRWDIGGQMTDVGANIQNPHLAGDAGYGADWDCWQNQNGFGLKTGTQCAARYMNEIHAVGKGIVLMHDSDNGNMGNNNVVAGTGNTIDMVKQILIPQLKAEGYTFVRTDDVPAIKAALPPSPCDASCNTCTGPAANECSGCTDGKYLTAGKTCAACNAACVTCSGGGAASCTSCAPGKYGASCNACSVCAADKYEVSACTANANTVCGACDASCATCTGAGAGECASCKGGTYLNGSSCTACAVCGASTFLQAACTTTANTVCGACDASCTVCSGPNPNQCGSCPPGLYLGGGACHACAVCAAGTSATAACAASANTKCAPCAAGTVAAAPAATSCTACQPGTFSASAGGTACSPCAAGTFSGASAAACSPCAAGTFAAAGAASCAACAPGTYAAPGATSCASCGDCDDNDACTEDACDKAKGCAHTVVARCTPTGQSTTIDAGEPPPAPPGDEGGCSMAPRSRTNGGMFLVGLGALAMLLRRRRSSAAHS